MRAGPSRASTNAAAAANTDVPEPPFGDQKQTSTLSPEESTVRHAHGDGLGPCRRLIDAASSRLTDTGTLLLQLYGRVVAAVSVSGPVDRTTRQPGKRYANAVVDAAQQVEAALTS